MASIRVVFVIIAITSSVQTSGKRVRDEPSTDVGQALGVGHRGGEGRHEPTEQKLEKNSDSDGSEDADQHLAVSVVALLESMEGTPCTLGIPPVVFVRHFETDFDHPSGDIHLSGKGAGHAWLAGKGLAKKVGKISKVYAVVKGKARTGVGAERQMDDTAEVMVLSYRAATGLAPNVVQIDQADVFDTVKEFGRGLQGCMGDVGGYGAVVFVGMGAGPHIEAVDSIFRGEDSGVEKVDELEKLREAQALKKPFPSPEQVAKDVAMEKEIPIKQSGFKEWGMWQYRGHTLTMQCDSGRWSLSDSNLIPESDLLKAAR